MARRTDALDLAATTALACQAAGVVLHAEPTHGQRRLALDLLRQARPTRWIERERYGVELAEYLIGLAARVAFSGEHSLVHRGRVEPRGERPLDEWIEELRKREIEDALAQAAGNLAVAARLLGVKRTTLLERARALGLWRPALAVVEGGAHGASRDRDG